jgi:RecA-family ATPase
MAILIERVLTEIEDRPDLVIVDTLARCFDGEESETGDMGRFIGGVDQLRSQLGCTVMVIHHTRLADDRERGNTAFRGAADAMMQVYKDDNDIKVSCTKQKDDEEFKPLYMRLTKIEGTDSCVVVPAEGEW